MGYERQLMLERNSEIRHSAEMINPSDWADIEFLNEEKLMQLPIWPVLKWIPASLFASAPEKIDQLPTKCGNLNFRITDELEWNCESNSLYQVVYISRRTVEVLWSGAYTYYVFYKKVVEGRLELVEKHVDLTRDSAVKAALEHFRWFLSAILAKTGSAEFEREWPNTGIIPGEASKIADDDLTAEVVASELTLVACGWVIHHELGHIAANHGSSADNSQKQEEEFDADDAAADWLLGDLDPTSTLFFKRALGMAVAMCLISGIDLIRWKMGRVIFDGINHQHPPGFMRLKRQLDRYIEHENHTVWAFALAIVQLHAVHTQISVPLGPYDSFRQAFLSITDSIEARASNTPPSYWESSHSDSG